MNSLTFPDFYFIIRKNLDASHAIVTFFIRSLYKGMGLESDFHANYRSLNLKGGSRWPLDQQIDSRY